MDHKRANGLKSNWSACRMFIEKSNNIQSLTQKELLNFINDNYHKIQTSGWVNYFLLRYSEKCFEVFQKSFYKMSLLKY